MTEQNAARVSLRTAAILTLFTVLFTTLMAATYQATKPAIEASAEAEKLKLVGEVLPAPLYDNALLADYVDVAPRAELGLAAQDDTVRVLRARRAGAPAALVFEAVAPDGYGGKIRLIIAVGADNRLIGVRVVSHKETPGLGDYIDPKKDRNKSAPWIRQFDATGFGEVPIAGWKVKKDGGRFDARAGATISARAVTNAVGRALQFAADHRDKLYALPAQSVMEKEGQ
ncbi:MAG: RnfABCDGE type electron transport complex subunit G [Rhodocyclales bacterium]|nr:RnfABCDGE type electron transport complex subunit G [Rhodocyclales bacterium]